MFKKFSFGLLMASLLFAASCGNNGHPDCPPTDKVDAFVQVLLQEDAILDVEVLKNLEETQSEGWIVIRPKLKNNYDDGLGAYEMPEYVGFAVNLNNFEIGDAWDDFLLKSVQNPSPYGGYFHLLENFVESDSYGNFSGSVWDNSNNTSVSMIFTEERGPVKDLEKLGAIKEAYATKKIKDVLTYDYGLSEKRSADVAKLVINWKKISGNRSMTNADADAFTKKLIGVNINEATNAYKRSIEGDSSSLDSLIKTAANANETSPESMRDLFNNLVFNK